MQTINLKNFTEDVDGKLTLASGYQLENLLIWKWNFHFFNGVKSDYIGLPLKSGSCCAVIWTKLLLKKSQLMQFSNEKPQEWTKTH